MKIQKIVFVFFLFFFSYSTFSFADDLRLVDSLQTQFIEKLQEGNGRFIQGKLVNINQNLVSKREKFANDQKPFAIVLSCSDSRVPPEMIFDQGLGDLFVIRVAGNVLNSDNIASIEYAVKKLEAHLIIVMGHDSCGAVQAAINSSTSSTVISPALERLNSSIRKNILIGEGSLDNGASGNGYYQAAFANARGVIKSLLKESQLLESQFERKRIVIIPAIYSVESGRVEFGKPAS